MKTNNSAAQFLAARVVALRSELSETQRSPDRHGKRAMVAELKRSLFALESRLAEVA